MKKYKHAWLWSLVLFFVWVPDAAADFEAPCGTTDLEIFVAVEQDVNIAITNLETGAKIYDMLVEPENNIVRDCDWLANVGGDPSGIEGVVNLEDNTPYKIKIGNYEYTYFGCEPDFDLYNEGFYCPNGGNAGQADLYFIYEDTGRLSVAVYLEGIASQLDNPDINGHFSDTNWIVPYNLDVVCANSRNEPGCLINANQISFFLSPQQGPAFTLTSADLVLPAGKTWYWGAVELRFAAGKQLKVYGTLNAQGTTFTAGSSSWGGIRFESGSAGSLDGFTLDAVSGYAALQIAGASPTIANGTIASTSGGIAVSGSSSAPVIHHNTITGGSYGLLFYDAGGYVFNNEIVNESVGAGQGVYASVYADPYLSSSGSAAGNNKIYGFAQGLWAETAASIWTGSGTNCIYDNTSYDAYAMDGGAIYAEGNWWGGAAPYVNTDETGLVDFAPYLSGSLCPASGASKMQPLAASSGVSSAGEELQAQLLAAKRKAVEGQYAEAVELMKAIVAAAEASAEGGEASAEAGVALVELGRLLRQRQEAALAAYLEERAAPGAAHRAAVLGLLVGYHRARGEAAAALLLAEQLGQSFAGTWQAFYGQWQAFDLHLEAGRHAAAAQVLSRMAPTSAAEERERALASARLAERARAGHAAGAPQPSLSQLSLSQQAGAEQHAAAQHAAAQHAAAQHAAARHVAEAALAMTAYPNPFNPATEIRFTLPEAGAVRLVVYDLTGRQVRVLTQGPCLEAGTHALTFEAGGLASGTYVYRLETPRGALTRTMLLMK